MPVTRALSPSRTVAGSTLAFVIDTEATVPVTVLAVPCLLTTGFPLYAIGVSVSAPAAVIGTLTVPVLFAPMKRRPSLAITPALSVPTGALYGTLILCPTVAVLLAGVAVTLRGVYVHAAV